MLFLKKKKYLLLPSFYFCLLQGSAGAQSVRSPIFADKEPEQQFLLASQQIGLYLLMAVKPATNSKQLVLVYCPSIVCILEQTAFQRQESQEDLESLKQAFPFSVLNTALHSCLKKKTC